MDPAKKQINLQHFEASPKSHQKGSKPLTIAQKQWDNEEEDGLPTPNSFYTYNTNPWRVHPYSTIYQG